ncbi:MAG: hypothetical protein LBF88_02990 [Planctomycetaceae bacterium]|jgi:hypothetical protein|nr:hypothetical protein [Planctomycetaceae bacterium]
MDNLLRQHLPAAFSRGRGNVFTPTEYTNIKSSDPSTVGLFWPQNNRPIILPKFKDRDTWFARLSERDRTWLNAAFYSAKIKSALLGKKLDYQSFLDRKYNEYLGFRVHSGAHERWHNLHRYKRPYGARLEWSYPNDAVRLGVDEVLADNMGRMTARKVLPDNIWNDASRPINKNTDWYQQQNIKKYLRGSKADRALEDLLKTIHPVTGLPMDLSTNVRYQITKQLERNKMQRIKDWVYRSLGFSQ